ncbi:immune inhibitor A domain-containing protein [Anaeromyxobacter dehalogenans]|uniref:Peptidase M6, immune inhibitor A n=1 Tax=Anaeromyxobacter dehalogenans (strain 2CP-C) TaxID=290397 RepID=Q2IP74_ANADE|nr:immune inhibitor A domain-containing protein [Anaeromyxobacter dehalogenans]ABC80604.1 peptidase M6, immune inhibitor A [Anaeromyxobacter dehalogenans 2CP-C]
MNRILRLGACAFLMLSLGGPRASASSWIDEEPAAVPGAGELLRQDDRPFPAGERQRELRAAALEARLAGKAPGRTVQVARGQYVELQREGEDAVWTVLGEFADLLHNQIPEPDRAVDNTTSWSPDFDRQHYLDLLFDDAAGANSLRNFYVEQSSNRYTVHGDVTEWIPVPGDAATYDDDLESPLGGNAVWYFLKDAVNGWYAAQLAAGRTPAELDAYLASYDLRDRYDYDGDGNFDEPDGYVDTVQFVHAGEGNEAGGGVLGDAAIWSHSWYAFYQDVGVTGPAFNPYGGIRIGESSYWIGKYTIQPENGQVGVFAHEFGHDLGLPDLYDTSGGDNGTGFWTLMSSGSWLGDGTVDIGSKSSHMGAWEKFQLGWLDYQVARAGTRSVHRLGPMEATTKQAQGLFVILPKKEVVTVIGTPYAGSSFYYSGAGDGLDQWMYRAMTLPAGATLSAKVRYDIELDWDYAYLVASTDGGATWAPLQTNRSTSTNPNGQNFGAGITGSSGGAWVDLTADLPAGDVVIGFRYWTDANTGGFGLMLDELAITGQPLDGAEAAAGWTLDGFRVSTGTETTRYNHYYVAEYRQYRGYDATLRTGPYYFGYTNDPGLQDYVDHFPYQDGLLVNYWDTSQRNNQTRLHPGKGLLLPIDAHYATLYRVDGGRWSNRIQTYDSTFSVEPTDAIPNLHRNGVLSPIPSLPGAPVFDDRIQYYDPTNPQGSVMNPNTGTQLRILGITGTLGGFMQLEVRPAR